MKRLVSWAASFIFAFLPVDFSQSYPSAAAAIGVVSPVAKAWHHSRRGQGGDGDTTFSSLLKFVRCDGQMLLMMIVLHICLSRRRRSLGRFLSCFYHVHKHTNNTPTHTNTPIPHQWHTPHIHTPYSPLNVPLLPLLLSPLRLPLLLLLLLLLPRLASSSSRSSSSPPNIKKKTTLHHHCRSRTLPNHPQQATTRNRRTHTHVPPGIHEAVALSH